MCLAAGPGVRSAEGTDIVVQEDEIGFGGGRCRSASPLDLERRRPPWALAGAAAASSGPSPPGRVPVEGGVCLYLVPSHPGWDHRHCPNGLFEMEPRHDGRRPVRAPLAAEFRLQRRLLAILFGEQNKKPNGGGWRAAPRLTPPWPSGGGTGRSRAGKRQPGSRRARWRRGGCASVPARPRGSRQQVALELLPPSGQRHQVGQRVGELNPFACGRCGKRPGRRISIS